MIVVLALGLLLSPPAATADTTPTDRPDSKVEELKAELEGAVHPDSIRYHLAIAYRERGSVDDRVKSLQIFDRIRAVFWTNPDFHWEWGKTYLESERFADAREAFARVIERRPDAVEARLSIATLLMKSVLRYYRLDLAHEVIAHLDIALAIEPIRLEALFLKSLAHQLVRDMPGQDAEGASNAGRACTEKILRLDPAHITARLLHAVHCFDLGDLDDADLHFQDAIAVMPDEVAADYVSPAYTAGPDELATYASLEPSERPAFLRTYWLTKDPTPLTPANESQLEFWKRMTLADLYFGDPESDIPGWRTDPGEVFVRYGPPSAAGYHHASFVGGGARTQHHPTSGPRGGLQATFDFIHPSWTWRYDFEQHPFAVTFYDINLKGTFKADMQSQITLAALHREAPAVFNEAFPGEITRFYVAGVARRGQAGLTREEVVLCIASEAGGRLALDLVEHRSGVTSTRKRRVSADDLFVLVPGTAVLVVAETYDLEPGRYTLRGTIDEPKRKRHGSFSVPLEVPPYGTGALQVSELELALAIPVGSSFERLGRPYVPNPMALVGDDRNLNIYFEIYNLVPDARHMTHFRTRYTVVPRTYALAYAEAVRTGRLGVGDPIRLGGIGVTLGGVTLSRENYTDVTFPDESARLTGAARFPKGAEVDLSDLIFGDYAVLVIVTDLKTQRSATSHTHFKIVSNEELRALLGDE